MAVIRSIGNGYDINSKRIPGKLSFDVGEVFSAKVVNSNGSAKEVTLKLSDGWQFDAKIDNNMESIPEGVMKFQVEGFEEGKLVIKLVSGKDDSGNTKSDKTSIDDILMQEGLKSDKDDYELLSKMIKHNMPLTKENISKMKTLLDFKEKIMSDENYEDSYIERYLVSKGIDISSDKGKELKAALKGFFKELKNISEEDILSLYENGIELTEDNIKSFNRLIKQDSTIYKDVMKIKSQIKDNEVSRDDEINIIDTVDDFISENETEPLSKENLGVAKDGSKYKEENSSVNTEASNAESKHTNINDAKNRANATTESNQKDNTLQDAEVHTENAKADTNEKQAVSSSLLDKDNILSDSKTVIVKDIKNNKNIENSENINSKEIYEADMIENKDISYDKEAAKDKALDSKLSQTNEKNIGLVKGNESERILNETSIVKNENVQVSENSNENNKANDLNQVQKEVKSNNSEINSMDKDKNSIGKSDIKQNIAGEKNVNTETNTVASNDASAEGNKLNEKSNMLNEKIPLKELLKEQISMKTEEMKNVIKNILGEKNDVKPEIYEKIVSKLSESINDFKVFNSISNQYYYLDLPINMRNDQYQCKIIIKDDRKKEKKIDSRNVKFVVSVKTKNMDVVDAYIKVKNIDINIDLRCQADFIKLLASEKDKLVKDISNMGYNTIFNVREKLQDVNLINCREFFEDTDINTINVKV